MSMLGDLSEFALPNLFQMFERSGKTGQLSVWSLTGVHRIIFSQGRIVAAISPEAQYSLKAMVCKLGTLSDQAIRDVKGVSELTEPLGKLLTQQQLVNSSLLALAFRRQIQIAVYPLFHLEGGQFRFSAKTPIPYEEMTGMSKSSIEVAMNALRQCEASCLVYDDLPLPDSRFMRTSAELPLFKLSSIEWSVLENVSPESRLSDLSQLLKSDLLEVRQACCRLAKVSLVEEVQMEPTLLPDQSKAAEAVAPMASAMQQRLQNLSESRLSEKVATSSQVGQTAVNSNLLSRFASMLKGI